MEEYVLRSMNKQIFKTSKNIWQIIRCQSSITGRKMEEIR